jgi:hypothetical protein
MGSLSADNPAQDAVSVSRKNYQTLLNHLKVICLLLAQS